MKGKRLFAALLLAGALGLAGCTASPGIVNPWVQEYMPGQGNVKGCVDVDKYTALSPSFAIGADAEGYAVFKDPEAALRELEENYGEGLALIQKEFGLESICMDEYVGYKLYGWQVSTGTEEEKAQARFVSSFLDIYENSFEIR